MLTWNIVICWDNKTNNTYVFRFPYEWNLNLFWLGFLFAQRSYSLDILHKPFPGFCVSVLQTISNKTLNG